MDLEDIIEAAIFTLIFMIITVIITAIICIPLGYLFFWFMER